MNCAICGKDNQPGTRFCVHCGAALAAAASAPPPAATAAAPRTVATPASGGGTTATSQRPAVAPVAAEPTGMRSASPAPAGSVPAYDAEPKPGGGRIIALIGLAAIVIAGGYIGYKIFGGSLDVRDSLARIDASPAAKVEPPPSAPAKALPADIAPPSAAVADAPKGTEDKSAAPKADESKPDIAPADLTKAPPTPPKMDAKAAAKATMGPPAPASPAPSTPAASPAPNARAVAPAPAPAPAAAPAADRWAQFAEDLRHCQSEGLFNRIVCDQRVRLRYCDGYWGKVPQCPGAIVNPDRGQ